MVPALDCTLDGGDVSPDIMWRLGRLEGGSIMIDRILDMLRQSQWG
jgi:hypothetical protein